MDVPATSDKERKPSPAIENAVTKLWTQIRRSGEMIVTLRDENERLHQRVEDLESGLSHRESDQQRLDQEQKDRSERLLSAENERDALAKQLSRLTSDHERLKQQFESDQQVLEHASAELEDLKSAAQDNEFLRAELVTRNNQIHAGQKELLEYRTKVAELEDALAKVQSEALEKNPDAQNSTTTDRNKAAVSDEILTDESANDQSGENTSSGNDEISSDSDDQASANDASAMAAEHAGAITEISVTDLAADESKADDAERGRGEIEALRAELERMRRLYDEVSIERERLRQSSAPYQDNLFSAGVIEKEWREKNSELYAEIERLAAANNDAEDQLLEALAEIDVLRAKVEKLEAQIKALEEHSQSAEQGRPEHEYRAQEAQALQLRRQVDQLKTQIKELEEGQTAHALAPQSDAADQPEAQAAAGEALKATEQKVAAYSRRIQELESELRETREQAGEVDGLSAEKRQAIESKVREALARVDSLLQKT